MITEKDLAFRLSGSSSTYAFHINSVGKPISDYFGPRLLEEVPLVSFAKKMPCVPGTSVVYDEEKDASFALDSEKTEFSTLGKGDFSSPAAILYSKEAGYLFDFVYSSHEIHEGIEPLEDFPFPHGHFTTLLVELIDKRSSLVATLIYALHEETGTILRATRLKNNGTSTVSIERLASYSIDMHLNGGILGHLSGGWANEGNLTEEPLTVGRKVLASHLGLSSNRANPFFYVKENGTTLFSGIAYSFNLIYSASHFFSLETTPRSKTRVMAGIDDEGFHFDLKPGRVFETPYATLSCSEGGINGAMRKNHRFVTDCILPSSFKETPRYVLLNNWEGTYFKFNEAKILALAKDAKKLGVELFVLDDGWFKNRNDDFRALGDYESDSRKLPHGIAGLAKKITKMGLKFGLWVEPEAISEDSDLYRAHPEYAIASPGIKPSLGRHELVLDLSKDVVVDHVLAELTRLFTSAPISYVKWDMNRPLSDFPPRPDFILAYAKGLYRLLKSITARFPDIYFQGCASGGNRFDLGILSYFPEIWGSDNTDPIFRLGLQTALAIGYPMRTIGSHVAASPSHQTLRKTNMATRFDVASFGGFGYELSTRDLTPLERKEMAAEIAYYKKHRKLFQEGQFFLLNEPGGKTLDWELLSHDASEGFIASFRLHQDPTPGPSYLRGYCFIEDALYEVESRPFDIDLTLFGGLINQVLPFHVNPNGLLVNVVSKRKGIASDVEKVITSGRLINDGKCVLHEEWSGTGLNDEVKVRGDFSSRLYYIRKIKNPD